MSDGIRSVIGFDASDAIKGIDNIANKLQELNQAIRSPIQGFVNFNASAGKTVDMLKQIADNARAASEALKNLNKLQGTGGGGGRGALPASTIAQGDPATATTQQLNAISKAQRAINSYTAAQQRATKLTQQGAKDAAGGVNRLTVSWETLTRVVQTQLIVRGINQIRNALKFATKEAIAFEQAIGRTLIVAPGTNFEQLAAGARELSDTYNIDLQDAVSAINEAFQNQLGELGSAEDVMKRFGGTAAAFAKATGSTTTDAVGLLSGAIKAYGLSLDEADLVAGQFFKLIEVGRVNSSELANSMGRLFTATDNVNISMNEMNAALGAITLTGLGASEATTQIRALTTAFTKPSPALKEALREAGFESADLALEVLGLVGTLEAIDDFAKGNPNILGKIFPNVRARGAFDNLQINNFEQVRKNIEDMEDISSGDNLALYLEATNNEGEKLAAAMNRLSNALTVDLGRGIIQSITSFLNLSNGIEIATVAIQSAGPALLGFGASVALFTSGLTAALGPLGILLVSIPALIGLLNSLDAAKDIRERNRLEADLNVLRQQNEAELKTLQQQNVKRRKITEAGLKDGIKAFANATQAFRKEYLNTQDLAKSANDLIVSGIKNAAGEVVKAAEDIVKGYEEAISAIERFAKTSLDTEVRILDQLSDLDFRKSTRGLDDTAKAFREIDRATGKFSEGRFEFLQAGRSGDFEGLTRGGNRMDEAIRELEQLLTRADSIGDPRLIAKVEAALEDLLRRRLELERNARKQQKGRIPELQKEQKQVQAIVEELKAQQKILNDNADIEFLPDGERERRRGLRKEAEQRIQQLAGQLPLGEAVELGLGDAFFQNLQNNLTALRVNVDSRYVQQQLQGAYDTWANQVNRELNIDVRLLFPEASSMEEVMRGFVEESDRLIKLIADQDKLNEDLKKRESAREEAVRAGSKVDTKAIASVVNSANRAGGVEGGVLPNVQTLAKSILDLKGLLDTLSQSESITPEQLQAVKNYKVAIDNFRQSLGVVNGEAAQADALGLDTALVQIDSYLKEIGKLAEAPTVDLKLKSNIDQEIQKLQTFRQALTGLVPPSSPIQAAGNALFQGAAAVQAAGTTTFDGAISAAQALSKAAADWIEAVQTTPAAPSRNARGGFQYFARGGRGTDSINAMLSPGETVVDARNSQRFFSELQAIRAGNPPRTRQVSNSTTVGDINVNVNGGGSATVTAREIGQALKREIRRGTLRL